MARCWMNMIKESMMEENSKDSSKIVAELIQKDDNVWINYSETTHPADVAVAYVDRVLSITRQGEVTTRLQLQELEEFPVYVESEYGDMTFSSFTTQLVKEERFIFVEYELYAQDELIDQIQITWQFLKEEMA